MKIAVKDPKKTLTIGEEASRRTAAENTGRTYARLHHRIMRGEKFGVTRAEVRGAFFGRVHEISTASLERD